MQSPATEPSFQHFMYNCLYPAQIWIPLSILFLAFVCFLLSSEFDSFIVGVTLFWSSFLLAFHVLIYRVARFKTRSSDDDALPYLTVRSSVALAAYFVSHGFWCLSLIFLTINSDSKSGNNAFFWASWASTYSGFILRATVLVFIYFEPIRGQDQDARSEDKRTILEAGDDEDEDEDGTSKSSCLGKLMFKSLYASMILLPGYFFVYGIRHDGTLGAPIGFIFGMVSFFWLGYHLILVREAIHKNQQRRIDDPKNYFISYRMIAVLIPYYICCTIKMVGLDQPVTDFSELIAVVGFACSILLLFMVYCEPTSITAQGEPTRTNINHLAVV